MKTSTPPADAFTVARIRKAGALILAKANLQEFARGGMSISSLGGQVRNPYDLGRTPGGSSGGTGARSPQDFAVLSTCSDTGQSIRSPASANNLVGIRPTRGLVSRAGVIPNSLPQDEVGPIAAQLRAPRFSSTHRGRLDPADPVTAFGIGHIPKSYTQLLSTDALKGARIGVHGEPVRDGRTPRRGQPGDGGRDRAGWQGLGAEHHPLRPSGLRRARRPVVSTSLFEARTVMDRYFAVLGPNAPSRASPHLDRRPRHPRCRKRLEAELAVVDGMNSQPTRTAR